MRPIPAAELEPTPEEMATARGWVYDPTDPDEDGDSVLAARPAPPTIHRRLRNFAFTVTTALAVAAFLTFAGLDLLVHLTARR